MRSSRSVILLLSQSVAAAFLGASMVGCQPPPKPLPPPPAPTVATPAEAQQISLDLNRFGKAHVGRVNAISDADKLAAITGIADTDVKLGDVISILDGVTGKVVANGTITYLHVDKETNTPAIVVKYDLSPDGGRTPIKGDLAVTQLPPN
jgi:hypothetical protein